MSLWHRDAVVPCKHGELLLCVLSRLHWECLAQGDKADGSLASRSSVGTPALTEQAHPAGCALFPSGEVGLPQHHVPI